MDEQLQQLVEAHNTGRLSRRDFIRQAGLLLSGVAVVGISLGSASEHEEAAAQATPAPTLAATISTGNTPMNIVTNMVTFKTKGPDAPGYLARPDGAGPYPGVVVIQEWWGLNAEIKEVCDLMAKNGFAALAPDLYRGEVATEPNEAQKLAMNLIMDQAIADIQGAADYLTQQSFVGPKKAGIMGFCFGGMIAMTMAWAGGDNIGAVVSFYGAGAKPTEDNFKNTKVPILGLYGDKDPNFTPQLLKTWQDKFKQYGKIYEVVTYPDAGHAFFNSTESSYRPADAQDAFIRTLAWFNTYLLNQPNTTPTPAVTPPATQEPSATQAQ